MILDRYPFSEPEEATELARHSRVGAFIPDSGRCSGGRDPGVASPGADSATPGAGNHRKDSLDQSVPATQGKCPGLWVTYVRISQAADRSRRHVPVLRPPRRQSWHGARDVAPGFVARSPRVWRATQDAMRGGMAVHRASRRLRPVVGHGPAGRRPLSCGHAGAAWTGGCLARCASCSADQQ
jgi:hypothetical protein